MQYHRMGLMDAYLLTRARRLNVLIQPNLRFFHELFGWEVELARKEAEDSRVAREAQAQIHPRAGGAEGDMTMVDGQDVAVPEPRRIMYSWPAFCRDLVSGGGRGGYTRMELMVALPQSALLVQLAWAATAANKANEVSGTTGRSEAKSGAAGRCKAPWLRWKLARQACALIRR